MTEQEFWDIVESCCWEEEAANVAKRPYETIKVRLQNGPLATQEQMEEFRSIFSKLKSNLGTVITEFEERTGASCKCGDDSFDDLRSHIIGCGREVYEAELSNPELAVARGASGNYKESFAYAIPYASDYEPTNMKLGSAVDGLKYWQETFAAGHSYAASEVEIRSRKVHMLRERLLSEGGVELTQEEYKDARKKQALDERKKVLVKYAQERIVEARKIVEKAEADLAEVLSKYPAD